MRSRVRVERRGVECGDVGWVESRGEVRSEEEKEEGGVPLKKEDPTKMVEEKTKHRNQRKGIQ